jgi:hypothetical protein
LRFEHEDQEESDDSLFEILTGRTARFKDIVGSGVVDGSGGRGKMEIDIDEDGVERDEGYRGGETVREGGLDDTFREKRGEGRYDVERGSERGQDRNVYETSVLRDTFREELGRERQDGYEEGGLGESGLDEMF